jgi:hypothetical protein
VLADFHARRIEDRPTGAIGIAATRQTGSP